LDIKLKDKYIKEIEDIKSNFEKIELSDNRSIINVETRAFAVIKRISGINSEYFRKVKDLDTGVFKNAFQTKIKLIMGILDGLYQDLNKDYLNSLVESIHDDIFSDYIEMAQYLLDENCKDAAAVIAGSTLEEHLRKLCEKNKISSTYIDSKGKEKFKKADLMNSELTKDDIYTKGEQKQVTAWLDIRNNAAHGHYDNYDVNQVKNMIIGLIEFFVKHPA